MNPDGSPLTLLRMTSRNLYRRPVRTALTALGVAIGVVSIVAFTTIVRGMWVAVDSLIHFDEGDLVVFEANVAADLLSVLDEEETGAQLRGVPGVAAAVPTLWHVMPIEKSSFCLMLGLRLEDLAPRHANYVVAGRRIADDHEVALGTVARQFLGKDLDDTLVIRDQHYRVVEIFSTGNVFFDGAIVMTLPELQRLAGKAGQVTVFQIYTAPDADADVVAGLIERDVPDVVAVADAGEYHKVDQGLEILNGSIWAISFMAIVIGSIVVTNTMWMAVLERTREIGILRAVGWSQRRIVFTIVLEAAGVGLIGCLLGCPLGVGLAQITELLPVAEQFVEPVFDATPFLVALAVAVFLSVLGALLPAWRAARISPAEALHYE